MQKNAGRKAGGDFFHLKNWIYHLDFLDFKPDHPLQKNPRLNPAQDVQHQNNELPEVGYNIGIYSITTRVGRDK